MLSGQTVCRSSADRLKFPGCYSTAAPAPRRRRACGLEAAAGEGHERGEGEDAERGLLREPAALHYDAAA